MKKKVLILKNDRTGDLLVSLKAINRIINKHDGDKKIIFLSNVNHKFNFLFPDIEKKIIPMNLSVIDKFKIFFFILFNDLDFIYILAPKKFYFYLPFFFRRIKFYGITIKSLRNRPNNFLLRYLHKFVIIDRLTLTKRNSSYLIQESLIEKISNKDNIIKVGNISHQFDLPSNYVFFHYKHALFFKLLNWDLKKIELLLDFLKSKYENVLFSSELFNDQINNYFLKRYNTYDFILKKQIFLNDKKIYFLKDIDGYDLFDVVKNSTSVICPEGIISHIAYLLNKNLLTLMHFNLKNKQDFINQIISCKEWFPPSNYKFCVLKKNFNKSLLKLQKRIV